MVIWLISEFPDEVSVGRRRSGQRKTGNLTEKARAAHCLLIRDYGGHLTL